MKTTLTLLTALLLAPLAVLRASELPTKKPNVVLFLVDDMGWMDCGAYGSQYYKTPHMDAFAGQAMRFTDAYSMPLCSPTRASILSGQYTSRHGVTSAVGHTKPVMASMQEKAPPNAPWLMPESGSYLEPSQYTLAEALRDAGYKTAHIGKWHLGLTEPHWPEAQGFDFTFHCHPDAGPPGKYFSPYGVTSPGSANAQDKRVKSLLGNISDGPEGEYIVDRQAAEAEKFIEANKDRPFFLNLWCYGVHGPWGHKEAYTAEFAKTTDPRGTQGNPIMASMLRSVDECFGRILARLDSLGLAENTIVIFTSDNGGNNHSNSGEDAKTRGEKASDPTLLDWRKWAGGKPPTNNAPLRDGKGRLYEGGTRVPLMVRWPGKIAPATTSDAIVGCIDIYPTVLELAGLPLPAHQKIDGVSYQPVLRGTGKLKRDAYFIWFPHLVPGVSVRQGDWKLIRRFTERPADYEGVHELFNLKEDLGETKNLAAQMPDKVKALDKLIDAFVHDTGALYPKPNPDYKPRPPAPQPAAAKASVDPAAGLIPKFCTLAINNGVARVEANGRTPFLGTAQVKATGPLTLILRARSTTGGPCKLQWTTKGQAEFPESGQTVEFTLPAGESWQEVKVDIPLSGELRITRLYLPADRSPVEIASIEYTGGAGGIKSWNFTSEKP
jgi:arylsulfatase A-like enzyme